MNTSQSQTCVTPANEEAEISALSLRICVEGNFDAREGMVRPVRQSLVVRAGAQQKLFRRQAERAVNVDVTTTPISG
jgi:hypothetical protein